MKVTTKGQVTIPQFVREKLGIGPSSEIDFVEENGRFYIVKKKADEEPDDEPKEPRGRFFKLRGVASVRMTTDEITALTREDEREAF